MDVQLYVRKAKITTMRADLKIVRIWDPEIQGPPVLTLIQVRAQEEKISTSEHLFSMFHWNEG